MVQCEKLSEILNLFRLESDALASTPSLSDVLSMGALPETLLSVVDNKTYNKFVKEHT